MRTNIRRFNEEGLEKFKNFIFEFDNGKEGEIPESFLTDYRYCETVSADIKIERLYFTSKKEIVLYIYNNIIRLSKNNMFNQSMFWTWLSAFYFDSICPVQSNGKRKVRKNSTYILNTGEWNRYYRHLLATPVRLYTELQDSAEMYLSGLPSVHGDLLESLASRQEIATSKGIIDAATILYWDAKNNKIKKNARDTKGPGILRRFAKSAIPQFQMTYDLNSMTGEEIVGLLPEEYDKWLQS